MPKNTYIVKFNPITPNHKFLGG